MAEEESKSDNLEQDKAESTKSSEINNEDVELGDGVEEVQEEKEEEKEEVKMVEIPESRLEELETAEERYMEELKRERAESINYRKRLQKQRDEFSEMASARVLTKVLAVQDDLRRFVENANDEVPEQHMEGVKLVMQRVEGIFNQEGVSLIKIEEGKTKYNPALMEAVVSQPIPNVEPNTVVGVISQGFKKGDRVLRPAKVMISKKPDPEPSVEGDDTESDADDESTKADVPSDNISSESTSEQAEVNQ